jgi:hypothetical protein
VDPNYFIHRSYFTRSSVPTDLLTFFKAALKSSTVNGTFTYSEYNKSATLEVGNILDIFEATLLFQLFAHWHIGRLSTQICYISATVPLRSTNNVVQINVFGHADLL